MNHFVLELLVLRRGHVLWEHFQLSLPCDQANVSLHWQALSNKSQHSISYTLSRSHSVIVEYTHDTNTDMFQVSTSTRALQ